MVQFRRSGGARHGIQRAAPVFRQLATRPAVLGAMVFLSACGNLQLAEIDTPTAPAVKPQKKVVKVATLKPAESTVGLASVAPAVSTVPVPQSARVRQALIAYHGDARYICSPSGFGQTSSCRLRGDSG